MITRKGKLLTMEEKVGVLNEIEMAGHDFHISTIRTWEFG